MKKTLTLYFSLFIISSLLISCSNSSHQSNKNSASANDPLTEHIDTTVNPANDFFSFANGKWFKENPIPASESSNGIFLDVQDSVNNAVKEICEKSSQNNNAAKGSNQQKIGDLYFTGMDTATINKVGITPLLPEFAVIDKINDIKSLLAEVASLNKLGVSSLFEFDVEQDQRP